MVLVSGVFRELRALLVVWGSFLKKMFDSGRIFLSPPVVYHNDNLMSAEKNVLIIDDDVEDCKIIEEALAQVGISEGIDCCTSVRAALEFLEANRKNFPKLVIIDLNMPEMNGIVGLEAIIQRYDLKVVMYSSYCNAELVKEVKALGGIDCVKKGTSYADNLKFAWKVSEFLKGGAPSSEISVSKRFMG